MVNKYNPYNKMREAQCCIKNRRHVFEATLQNKNSGLVRVIETHLVKTNFEKQTSLVLKYSRVMRV